MQFYSTVRTLGRVGKWTVLSILAIIVGIVLSIENLLKMWGGFIGRRIMGAVDDKKSFYSAYLTY